jgi:hypothetical protein
MAGRGLAAGTLSYIAGKDVTICHLVDVAFRLPASVIAAPVYLTDAGANVAWNGNTYLASQLMSFEPIAESGSLRMGQVSVKLSGVPTARVAEFFAYNYLGNQITIRRLLLNASLAAVDAVPIFIGEMDEPTFEEDPDSGTSVIEWTCSAPWGDFERRNGRHTNHYEQQIYFPGDLGFFYVSQATKPVAWGTAGPYWPQSAFVQS